MKEILNNNQLKNNCRKFVKYLFLLLVVMGIIIVILKINNYDNKQKEKIKHLEYIFCQQLHRGMTVEEVRMVLLEYGEFEEYQYNYPGRSQIIIRFTGKDIVDKIGNINIYLNFFEGIGYVGPELLYGTDSKGICVSGLSE